MHYDTTVGCDLKAPVKGGGVQKLDRVHGHHDHVTRGSHGPVLDLKVDKNYHKMDHSLALTGQYVPKVGKTFLEVSK